MQNLASQEIVFLEGNEVGNGILQSRLGECFVITPNHVVDNGAGDILVKGMNNVNSKAKYISPYPLDLAILRVNKGHNFNCENWEISEYYESALKNVSNGYVKYLDEYGIENLIHVNIISKDEFGFWIIPQDPNFNFFKGMSGSSFYIDYNNHKILAGMLMRLGENSKEAFVYQMDDILRTLSPFFEVKTKKRTSEKSFKNLGVLITQDSDKNSSLTNDLVSNLNQLKTYKAVSKFTKNDYIEKTIDDILSGDSGIVVPGSIKKALDELLLGNVTLIKKTNGKNMHVIHANFTGGTYDTENFNLIKSISISGKGLGFDESSAEAQAIKSLIANLKNQMK